MKVFITKYALTKGILEKEVQVSCISPNMVIEFNAYRTTYHKPFWYEKMEDAVIHAQQLRERKIASLRKTIEKLEKIDFGK